MNKEKNPFGEYLPICAAIVILVMSVFVLIVADRPSISPSYEDTLLEARTGSAGPNFTSTIATTSGTYEAFEVISSTPAFLERITIPKSMSGSGILLYNATANNLNAILVASFMSAPVGSIEIGAHFTMGILAVTSSGLNPSLIYTPTE